MSNDEQSSPAGPLKRYCVPPIPVEYRRRSSWSTNAMFANQSGVALIS